MAKIDTCIDTLRACAKLLMARRARIPSEKRESPLIILANGPSLAQTIADHLPLLQRSDTMVVNFAANTDAYRAIRPRFYILADPYFFAGRTERNFTDLWRNIAATDWRITLLVPVKFRRKAMDLVSGNTNIDVASFNAIGIEGLAPLRNMTYHGRLAMPRPRNVLIAAIMCGIWLGYKEISIAGADHSWMETLAVDSNNRLVAIQRHFYAESDAEQGRVTTEYNGYRLHQIVESLAVAFRSYHLIESFARREGVAIYNATPRSYIDAFPRRPLE